VYKECNILHIEPSDELTLKLLWDYRINVHRKAIEMISFKADK